MTATPVDRAPADSGLDPHGWAEIYETARPNGHQLVFRASAEIARRACLAAASPGEHWLDVGCGTGHPAAALAASGLRVTGIDRDARMIAAARARFPDLTFELADATSMPLPDAAIDGVVATSVVGCLQDARGFAIECARVVRPGGTIVLSLANRTSPLHAIGNVLALLEPPSRTYAPARLFSAAEARDLVSWGGFVVSRLHYYNCFVGTAQRSFPSQRIASALELLINLHPWVGAALGRNLLVVASRPA